MNRIDYGMSPPGLIERAWCYSFFLGDDVMYAVVVAKGWRVGYRPRGLAESIGAKFGKAWAVKRTDDGYSRFDETAVQQMMSENKRSFIAPYADISNLQTQAGESKYPTMALAVNGKKYKFTFDGPDAQEAQEFFDQLHKKVG